MKTRFKLIGLLLCLGLLPAARLFAQASNTTRVAVISMQQAILNCTEGKKAAATLKQKYDAKAAELQKKKQEIDDMTAELQKEEKTLSEDAVADKKRVIDLKTKELSRAGDDANSEFQQLQSQTINAIGNRLLKVIHSYAVEQGYTLVIDNSSPQAGILYASPTTDITTEIIRRFDAQSAASTVPKPAAPAATKK